MAVSDQKGRSWLQRIWEIWGDDDTIPGAYLPTRHGIRVIQENESQFGEAKVVSRTPIVELNSVFGTSPLRDKVVTANGGTKDDVNGTVTTGEILLETNTDADGEVLLESAEIGRYISGYGAELGVGVRFTQAPTDTQSATWGGITSDGNNGFYFGRDATGVYVTRLRAGTEIDKTYQSDWNLDKLDGTGKSGRTLDLDNGNIFQIEWTWYGYGQIIFGVLGVVSGKQTFIPVHEMSDFTDTSVTDPSLRVFTKVENGGTTTSNLPLYVGGRQYSVVGTYVPKYRFTADVRGSTTLSTTVQPLISFRIKSGFRNRSIKLQGYTIVNDGNNRVYVELRLDGTLTGATFGTPGNYTASDTALESDTSATAITGGNVIWNGDVIDSSNAGNVGLADRDVDLDLPEESTITLCAASFSGTPAVFSGFRMKEEW